MLDAFLRHAERRRAGLATLSIFDRPARARFLALCGDHDLVAVVAPAFADLVAHSFIEPAAFARIRASSAQILGITETDLARATRHDLEVWRAALPDRPANAAIDALCMGDPALASVPSLLDCVPALALIVDTATPAHDVALLAEDAIANPSATIALCAPMHAITELLSSAPASRAMTLLRAGIMDDADAAGAPIPIEIDRARSEAERFIATALAQSQDLRGIFELNTRYLGWEIDLLCTRHRIAIEIDGYHHFNDIDAYRRDRRKDLELQRGGLLVLRIHADDVVARLEEILATVRSLIAERPAR